MCGILGSISKQEQHTRDQFVAALNLQQHRGPDGFGIANPNQNVLLGHRRLSIIDLEQSAGQPMVSLDKRYTLVFNGEIYNYRHLRKELEQQGFTFRTHSDTEVLLNAFIADGTACFSKLNGMFSCAIYDSLEKKIYLARDQLGIKPLYYRCDSQNFAFSSEIRSLLYLFPEDKSLAPQAISSYFAFRYPLTSESFFNNIKSLVPGHYMIVSDMHLNIKSYWNLTEHYFKQQEDLGEMNYLERLGYLLQDAIKLQSHADVPVGAFLSGGVDSSLISAYLAQIKFPAQVSTYTTGFKEDEHNEFPYARIVADAYPNIHHHEVILNSEDYIAAMDTLIDLKAAPLAVPNEVALYLMSCELKKEIKVVLSGEGADEIFGGYGRIFRSAFDFDRLQPSNNNFQTKLAQEAFTNRLRQKYKKLGFNNTLDHFLTLYPYIRFEQQAEFLNDNLNIHNCEYSSRLKFSTLFTELKDSSYENQMMYAFTKVHLPGLLGRVDQATMAASIEARVPFLDYRLVEFAAEIPIHYKLKWLRDKKELSHLLSEEISERYDVPKYILKKHAEKLLPREILYHKKKGFPIPITNIFLNENLAYTKEILLDERTRKRGLFKHSYLEQLLTSNIPVVNKEMLVWMMLNIELFCRKYID